MEIYIQTMIRVYHDTKYSIMKLVLKNLKIPFSSFNSINNWAMKGCKMNTLYKAWKYSFLVTMGTAQISGLTK